MTRKLVPSDLDRLGPYMPPGWRGEWGEPPSIEELAGSVSHLQALLAAVGAYLPQAVLTGGHEMRDGSGAFRHGTMLFADVSGFSTLMERFSQERGREGAEEITLIINRFLEAVNGIAVRYGGDLLKFAGDAALSFYQGPDHAARGCRAAWEMQCAVREQFACLDTSLGEFPLRMSIGLGTGEVLMASLGTPDNAEHAVMGEALATMGRAEGLAQAGQIFVDRATRDLAGERITVEVGHGGFFELLSTEPLLGGVGARELGLAPPDSSPISTLHWLLDRLDVLSPYLPPGLLSKLIPSPQQVRVESDHRWVTTIFADLRGANELVRVLGREHQDLLAQIVNRYFLAMREVVEQYEGVLHKVGAGPSGPHLFITFGAPKSHSDDPERAVRASLDMQEAMASVGRELEPLLAPVATLNLPRIEQAIGVTTGFVFAGSIGSVGRWEYTVMGDLVNLASRLMSAAADGEILASDTTVGCLDERFRLVAMPTTRVKGKRDPVSYSQVVGMARQSPMLAAAAGQLVGRQAEMDAARALLERAAHGSGGVLVVHGEAGMGKTRLTQEVVSEAQARGMRVVAGTCLSYGGEIPYLPWVDVLRELLGMAGGATQLQQVEQGLAAAGLAGWEPLVGDLLGLAVEETPLTASLDARMRQQRLFDIVLELVQYHSQAQPLLLVIEDVHWTDPTSLELVDYAARNVTALPVVLLILHRPREWLEDRWGRLEHAIEIALRELPGSAIEALLVDLLGGDEAPGSLVSLVLRKAQGNPFFTEEVVRALMDAGVLVRNGHWELAADPDQAGVPDTIHGVIQSRIDRLQETDRRVLQVASVIGRVFGAAVLCGAYPYDDLHDSLTQRLGRLGSLGLVLMEAPEPDPLFMFKHALTQDVAYESLSYARRREIHRRVGAFIEGQGDEAVRERLGFLAHHFHRGQAWSEALTYSLAAGRKAQREYANEVAIAHFERALGVLQELDEAHDAERLEVNEALGEVLTIAGRYDEALEYLQDACAMIKAVPPSVDRDQRWAELCRKTAEAHEPKGDYQTALDWLKQGLQHSGADTAESARLLRLGAGVFYRQGDGELASEWCEKSLVIAERLKDEASLAQASYLLGAILRRGGNLAAAAAHCQRSLDMYEVQGDLLGQAQAHNNLAMVCSEQDDWTLAAEHYRSAARIVGEIGYAEGQARVATNLGEIYLVQGDLAGARDQYLVALGVVERQGMLYGMALLHNNLGAVCVRGREWEEATAHLDRSLELFEEIGSEEFMAELFRHQAEVALGRGLVDQALAHAERSLAHARDGDMRLEEGMTWRVLGRVRRERGELDQAQDALDRALSIAQADQRRYEVALSHLELARLRRQQDDVAAGRSLARQAADVFSVLGARLDLEAAERLLAGKQGGQR